MSVSYTHLVVGVLQFDVLKFRLENEYNVEIRLDPLPYEYIRWIEDWENVDVARINGTSDMKKIKDLKDLSLIHIWRHQIIPLGILKLYRKFRIRTKRFQK